MERHPVEMAYTRRKAARPAARRAAPKRRASPARRPAKRATARRAAPRAQTVKIVIEHSTTGSPQAMQLARELGLPTSPASVRKSRF